jgi:hypothetical protein
MCEEPLVERHVIALDVVGQIGVPEPVPVRQQVPPADHGMGRAEDIVYECGRGDQDCAVPQVPD